MDPSYDPTLEEQGLDMTDKKGKKFLCLHQSR